MVTTSPHSSPSAGVSPQERYQQLSPLAKAIITFLAITYAPVTQTFLVNCLKEVADDLGLPRHPALDVQVKEMISRLAKLGLVEKNNQGRWLCHRTMMEIPCREAVKAGNYRKLATIINSHEPVRVFGSGNFERRIFDSELQFGREVRIGIYLQDIFFIMEQFEYFYYFSHTKNLTLDDFLLEMVDNPFDEEWIRNLDLEFLAMVVTASSLKSAATLSPNEQTFQLLQETMAQAEAPKGMLPILMEQLLLRGEITELKKVIKKFTKVFPDIHPSNFLVFEANLAVVQGKYAQAIEHYKNALKGIRRLEGKRSIFFRDEITAMLCILALFWEGSASSIKDAEAYLKIAQRDSDIETSETYLIFQLLLRWQQGDRQVLETLTKHCQKFFDDISSLLFIKLLVAYWIQLEPTKAWITKAENFQKKAQEANYQWFAMETMEILTRMVPEQFPDNKNLAPAWRKTNDIVSVLDILKPQSEWELSLNALANLTAPTTVSKTPQITSSKRLAWFITDYSYSYFKITPKEQSINKKGEWTGGRSVALKRLAQPSGDLDYLTEQDRKVCRQIKSHASGYYGQVNYEFSDQAFLALVGHPLVFWDNSPQMQIEVVQGEPQLQVKKSKLNRLVLKLDPAIDPQIKIMTIKDGLTRLKVIPITNEHRRIATILGSKNRLEVPISAQDQVLQVINSVASLVTVHSDIGGGAENVESLPTHSLPHIHILPVEMGLKIALLTRPFGDSGPYFQPGKGGETVITEIDGKRYQTTRNLPEEKEKAVAVIKACPTLILHDGDGGEWYLEDPENCLELLLELKEIQDQVKVEWPEGEKMRVSHAADFGQFKLNIKQQKDWFAAEGELQVDDNLVLGLQQLMELMEDSPGRFIALADGQFLALTNEFRQRLEELKNFSEKQGKGRRFHPLAALALEDMLDEAENVKGDRHWREHLQRIKEMKELDPQLPSTLQADLRDYQKEGFQWLARLAHWGVGACLADDMGLGKTLQALALILTKAGHGPTLIVAPTSVCPNWISEANRFAPTLNPFQFGSGDRQETLDNLQAFDVVVCTYGLLQQEDVAEMLAKVKWQVVVLDEAQAIKNMATKRSQAAMNLQAEFKVLTTGTPIENHLGELWNLFRFINPGLLGSLEKFNERFANPIERQQNKQARDQLKRLIQPFLLRRTKNQVLKELPARTEILLQVELSQEEMAFYEALRRQAITNLEKSEQPVGAKHLQVLAEIMRLRRACCNPSLIMSDNTIPSSKLETFGEILQELLENRHKALVFSQFVDHLAIIRNYLDDKSINYQYLDGSTPIKERKKRVDAFQNGEGDVFLISLKAGGTGLNLTAADYVIHMDPWWNPAVEDQASDRAHRIGQKRPVTIYRLVAQHTIEEKIVELHHQKRDLADSLLEGTDMSSRISTEQLLQLITAN